MRVHWAWRIGLVLLVGVNLTLLCAGHDDGDHHTTPHFALLGEPADADHPAPAAPHTLTTPDQLQATSPFLTTASLLDTLGLALLDVILAAGLACSRPPFRRVGGSRRQPGHPQTALTPERRPPRRGQPFVIRSLPHGGTTPAFA